MEFGFFITWLALSIIAGVIASNKGRSGIGFFLLGVILSPLVGIIAALIVAENIDVTEKQKLDTGTGKKCPYCAEIIKPEAKFADIAEKIFQRLRLRRY